MSSATIASSTIIPIFQYISLNRRSILFGWSRQVMIQLTVLLVGLFYTCSVLELDLGETGDSFGDVYDTYVPSTPVQTPKPTVGVHRKILPAQPLIAASKYPIPLPVDWSFVFVLAPMALYVYRPRKLGRLQVLHAVWRL